MRNTWCEATLLEKFLLLHETVKFIQFQNYSRGGINLFSSFASDVLGHKFIVSFLLCIFPSIMWHLTLWSRLLKKNYVKPRLIMILPCIFYLFQISLVTFRHLQSVLHSSIYHLAHNAIQATWKTKSRRRLFTRGQRSIQELLWAAATRTTATAAATTTSKEETESAGSQKDSDQ